MAWSLLLVVVGVAAPLVASRGLSAFTTDTARARDVATTPRTVPSVPLLDADSTPRTLIDTDRSAPRPALIVDFIATRCQTLCAAQNGIYQRLQRDIVSRGLASKVQLVTVSFDPLWDTPRALRYFAVAQRPNPSVWRVLTPRDTTALRPLLDSFGIRVVREGGEFVHNAALHVVSSDGRLRGIYPLTMSGAGSEESMERALAHALELAR